MTQVEFLQQAMAAALAGGHIWPGYAVCEAAEESNWGNSMLAERANNLFGQKYPSEPPAGFDYPSLVLPTHEYVGSQFVDAVAHWPIFPDWTAAFRERMALLRRLSAYAPALAATSGEEFIRLVSPVWATDPKRAANVLAIYAANQAQIVAALTAAKAPQTPPPCAS